MFPTYLILGHITRDVVPEGFVVGGTATYAALTASRLGETVAVVTAASIDPAEALPGALVHVRPSAATTTYENVYTPAGRVQYLRAAADPLDLDDVPAVWRRAPIVHLAPLADELRGDIVDAFPQALIGVTPQGWLRRFGAGGRVTPKGWDEAVAGPVLARADAVVLSEEDLGNDAAAITELARRARLLVVTRGARGATVYRAGEVFESPAFPAREVDPTGAGDVFAAAFLIELRDSRDPRRAAEWANCVASFAIEGHGPTAPTRKQVAARLAGRRVPGAGYSLGAAWRGDVRP